MLSFSSSSHIADGAQVLIGYEDGRVSGYSVTDGAEAWNIPAAHRGAVTCMTANDKVIVSGGVVRAYFIRIRASTSVWPPACSWSLGPIDLGHFWCLGLFVCFQDGCVRLWLLSNRKFITQLNAHKKYVLQSLSSR